MKVFALALAIFTLAAPAYAQTAEDLLLLPSFKDFNNESILRLTEIGENQSNLPIEVLDFQSYQTQLDHFAQKDRSIYFNQKDKVIMALTRLKPKAFETLFNENGHEHKELEIVMNRLPIEVIQQVSKMKNINPVIRASAKISLFGSKQTPAILSDTIVDSVAGRASAFSTLEGEFGVVYEVYRKNTFTDLIASHEGFHSAMRILTAINRANKLSKFIFMPIANGLPYDAQLDQDIQTLQTLAAPNLDEIYVDERFTSDHHGVIMATLHHGINTLVQNGTLNYPDKEMFNTNYPYNYIQEEKKLSDRETQRLIKELALRNETFITQDISLREALIRISDKLDQYQ